MSLRRIDRAVIIILDGAGIGESPDAADFGDTGTSTIPHVAEKVGGLNLPNMEELGLGVIAHVKGLNPVGKRGAYGKMAERSAGKDTTTGHWEIAGLITEQKFPTYPQGFPNEIIEPFSNKIGREILGNYPASGTVIIKDLGKEHMETGKPIVYTSADSVFQIATHEEVIPVEELYKYCKIARKLLKGEHAVGRVIARPFVGRPGNFTRTDKRHDFSLEPVGDTMLDILSNSGLDVMAVGKIDDIFANRGITKTNHVIDNMDTVDGTLEFMAAAKKGLIFANLVEFDMNYGHRNNPEGFARALKDFDDRLPEIIELMTERDLLIITADHGCDPTTAGTDHTREYVPLMVYHHGLTESIDLGIRKSFADIAATLGKLFAVEGIEKGEDFSGLLGL